MHKVYYKKFSLNKMYFKISALMPIDKLKIWQCNLNSDIICRIFIGYMHQSKYSAEYNKGRKITLKINKEPTVLSLSLSRHIFFCILNIVIGQNEK